MLIKQQNMLFIHVKWVKWGYFICIIVVFVLGFVIRFFVIFIYN